jgi:chemotaxis family two-component system sensor kinase Cph1
VDLAIENVALDGILEDILDSLHVSLEELNVEIRRPRPLPSLKCDKVRIGEVFRNLITNAMKYNEKDEKWIEIGWRNAQDPTPDDAPKLAADEILFYVRDNGIGIAEKHIDKVFTIFKRLHAKNKYGGGTGAGLTIVKKIVERHHGKIWLESSKGDGTIFYFTLKEH